jgi:hypothetical protein
MIRWRLFTARRIVYIVTHNINELSRVPGLSIDDWEV